MKKRYCLKLLYRLLLISAATALAVLTGLWRGVGSGIIIGCAAAVALFTAWLTGFIRLLLPGWDGTVTERKMRYTALGAQQSNMLPEYFMTVRSDSGAEHIHTFCDKKDSGAPNYIEYYDNGERVRKHRGFDYYEKFIKSGKNTVVCIGCGELVSKDKEFCTKCGLPLLKDDISDGKGNND